MKLYQRIPENLFSILASSHKQLYADALFVVRSAFKTELTIKKSALIAMLMDSLENEIIGTVFDEELAEYPEESEVTGLSGKAHLLLRRLIGTGWVETEYAADSFEETITVPDYAIKLINLLYELTTDEVKEYNSYVFATYSALKNAKEDHPEYLYQALSTAYKNTVDLLDELKTLFNNIKKYHQRISDEAEVNELLREHFDDYKTTVIDRVYHPLKTMDSVPRFKHAILAMLRDYGDCPQIVDKIIRQGRERGIYETEQSGREDILFKANFITDTYEVLGEVLDDIDRKHAAYTRASIDKMRYLLNADRSVKGKLVELLKRSADAAVVRRMADAVELFEQNYMDGDSLYSKVNRRQKSAGQALSIAAQSVDETAVRGFFDDVKKQYGNRRIDQFIAQLFGDADTFTSDAITLAATEDFLLLFLGAIRAGGSGVSYWAQLEDAYIENGGYRIPVMRFYKIKRKEQAND